MEGSSDSRAGQMLDVAFPPIRYSGTSSSIVPPLVSSFLAHNPELTSKAIGTFPGFQHHIKLAPDAVPVAVKTQLVPYAIEGKVADTVRLLDEQGFGRRQTRGIGPILWSPQPSLMGQYA